MVVRPGRIHDFAAGAERPVDRAVGIEPLQHRLGAGGVAFKAREDDPAIPLNRDGLGHKVRGNRCASAKTGVGQLRR